MKNFTWNESIFPHKTTLPETAATVHSVTPRPPQMRCAFPSPGGVLQHICELDEEVKDALATYSQIKAQLNAIDRRST